MKTTNPVCDVIRRCITGVLVIAAITVLPTGTATAQTVTPAQIMHDLRSFRVVGTVLHVGAHPDDENTQLIAYLARGRAYRTAYLSVTRGDGGQNLLSADLGEKLGVARTQELLAARRIDGGRQFFTRAIDYGFSKDYQEALGVWGHQDVLSDVVRVIRTFRPDVIVTRFSTEPGGTHGHHTASAVLALEAFKLAGDAKAFPEQLGPGKLEVWQPKRIFVNGGTQGRGGANADATAALRMDIAGTDPVLNESFASVATRSRGMHKTQGFGQTPTGGPAGAPGGPGGAGVTGAPRIESFQFLAGDPATSDIMQGVDTTWNRIPGGAPVVRAINDVIAQFNPADPSASVNALIALRKTVATLPRSPLLNEKKVLLDRIIAEAAGIAVQTVAPAAEYLAGETVPLRSTATVSSAIPVNWVGTRFAKQGVISSHYNLSPNAAVTRDVTWVIPGDAPVSQPYWLREQPSRGLYTVTDPSLIGLPESPSAIMIEQSFTIGGQTISIFDEPVAKQSQRRIDIIAPVALRFIPETSVFTPGKARTVTVVATAARAGMSGTVQLNLPAGWTATPVVARRFQLRNVNDTAHLQFTITPPAQPATTAITASAEVNGMRYGSQRIAIDYVHIPLQLLQPTPRLTASSFTVAHRGELIGYVAGAGDAIPEALEQMGYKVRILAPEDFTREKLKPLDAIVMGIRVANVRTDLAAIMPALFAYVQNGGTVIEQYSQTSGLKTTTLAPYSLTISGDRVTDENAAVTFLAPNHPVLNTPNRITADDFKGWVQELGTYYANRWDEHFTPIIAASDKGEPALSGGLLVAGYGSGHFVYTGLAFFRQLPAGVPGAYRLFANILSLGRSPIQ